MRPFIECFPDDFTPVVSQASITQEFADFDLAELSKLLSCASLFADSIRVQIHCLLNQLSLLEQQCDQFDQTIEELMSQIPQHITSIPGVSPGTGASILADIGDIYCFDAPEKLVAYAGASMPAWLPFMTLN